MPAPSEAKTEPKADPKALGPTAEDLLRILVGVMGRVAMPERQLRRIVSPSGVPKYVTAYNACNGTRSIREIARVAELDASNLAKVASRWVTAGVAFRVGSPAQPMLLHLYPLPEGEAVTDEDGGEASTLGNGSPGRRPSRPARAKAPSGSQRPAASPAATMTSAPSSEAATPVPGAQGSGSDPQEAAE